MALLNKPEDLVAVLGQVMDAPDPLKALKAKGFTFSPALQQKLAGPRPPKALSPQERARWVAKAKAVGPVKFSVRDVPLIAPALPAGEYDVVFGLRLGVVNEALVALYAAFTWPHAIAAEQAAQLFTLDDLRAFTTGVPDGANIQVGALNFTGPASVTPRPGTPNLILRQPFSLQIDRVTVSPLPPHLPRRIRVASLDGELTVGVTAFTETSGPDTLRFVLDGVQALPNDPEAVHLAIAPTSPLQPRSPQALIDLAGAVNGRFAFAVAFHLIEQDYSISPEVRLPLGSGVPIRLQRVDLRSFASGGDGVLVAGMLLGPTDTPDENAGDPDRLADPFTTSAANAYLRVHEELLRKVIQQALASGELQRQASEQRDDLRIDGADIELKTNEIRLILKARLVDACSFNKDLSFTATKTYRYSVFGGEITVTEEQDVNLDNTDIALCIILGALEAVVAGVAFPVIGAVVDIIAQIVHFVNLSPGGGENDPLRFSGIFAAGSPVPGTEVLPLAETLQSRVEELFMEANGAVSLVPDDVNTYVYVAFQRRTVSLPFSSKTEPIQDAQVELVDQDVPRPSGDDTVIPPSSETTHIGPKRLQTRTTVFEPPARDQVLAQATTDSSGLAKFVLSPAQLRTIAGRVITTTIVEDTQTGEIISQRVTDQPLRESRPDVYFRVTESNGARFDTLGQTGGFTLNLSARRIGAPGAPLTFTRVSGPVVAPAGLEHPGGGGSA